MKTFETTTIVEPSGEVRIAGVPFMAGTEVEVFVSSKRISGDDFRQQWHEVCQRMRRSPSVQSLSDEDIQAEITGYRARR